MPVVESRPAARILATYQFGRSGATLHTPASLKGYLTRRISSRLSIPCILADECNRPDCQRTAARVSAGRDEYSPWPRPTRIGLASPESTDTIGRFKPAAWRLVPAVAWPRFANKVTSMVASRSPKVNSPQNIFPQWQGFTRARIGTMDRNRPGFVSRSGIMSACRLPYQNPLRTTGSKPYCSTVDIYPGFAAMRSRST